jgi:hypothetical protein
MEWVLERFPEKFWGGGTLVLWFLAWIEEEILGNVVGCLDGGLELGVSGECTGFGMRPWFYNPKLVS